MDIFNAFFNMEKNALSNGDYNERIHENEVSVSVYYFFINNENI